MKQNLAIALLLVVTLAGGASAEITDFVAVLNGDQANAGAGTGSPATGSASVSYDSVTGELAWDISWSGLQGTPTLAHFHGPALPDQNAGAQVDIFAISGDTSPSAGSTVISEAQATDLLNELWYVNLHTTEFPGGEIRGQVVVDEVVGNDARSVSTVKSSYDE